MAFLSNKTVNYLNFHVALIGVMEQSYAIFTPIYLYTRGFSIAQVLALMALLNMLRMPLRFLCFPVIRRWGLKVAVMIGAAGYGLSFPVLGQVTGMGGWLIFYILLYSSFNALHWFAFHTFYSIAGEHEKRGRQVAVAQTLAAATMALTPFLSALVIMDTGFQHYFLLAIILAAVMLLSLSRCENIAIEQAPWREGRKAIKSLGPRIHLMESSITYPMNMCWMFAVYLYVGKILSLGGIVTFGVLVQSAYQLLLGSWVDKGRGAPIVSVAAALRALVAVGRALLPLSVPAILALEASSAVANVHLGAVEPTALYNAGKEAPHPLWFWLFTESAWDLGTLIGAGSAALLLAYGVELRHVILIVLPSIALLWRLLYGYFITHPYVHPSA